MDDIGRERRGNRMFVSKMVGREHNYGPEISGSSEIQYSQREEVVEGMGVEKGLEVGPNHSAVDI